MLPPRGSMPDRALRAVGWSVASSALGKLATVVIGVILARMLSPREFGVYAVAYAALRILVSRSRAPAFTTWLAENIGATLIPLGSAGAKAAAVILGEADAYIHDGGQYEWDSAAPVAVALAAGLHASRLNGENLRYNQPDPYLPDILICPVGKAGMLVEAISEARIAPRHQQLRRREPPGKPDNPTPESASWP